MDDQKCCGDCSQCPNSLSGNMMTMDCCVEHKVSKEHLKMKKEMLEKKLKMVKVELARK